MIVALLTLVVFAVTVFSSLSDIRSLRVPNVHTVIIMAAFALAFAVSPETFGRWWEPLASFALMFVVTYILFCLGVMGGGDTKIASALALWVGLKGFVAYLFYMTMIGGVLGIVSIVIRKKKPFKNPREGSWIAQLQSGRSAVPYCVPISFGAWISLFHMGFVHHQIDELVKIIH
jgi:prepilin peptidase CpaA